MNWSKTMLLASAAALALVAGSAQAQNMPKKIGYVTNYATHEWYQNVIKGMKDARRSSASNSKSGTRISTSPRRSPRPRTSCPRASTC